MITVLPPLRHQEQQQCNAWNMPAPQQQHHHQQQQQHCKHTLASTTAMPSVVVVVTTPNYSNKTEFPHFEEKLLLERLSDGSVSEVSEEDSTDDSLRNDDDDDDDVAMDVKEKKMERKRESKLLKKLEQKYSCRQDQDVAVFMAIAIRLPIRSLLHLLQGHAHASILSDTMLATPVAAAPSLVSTTTNVATPEALDNSMEEDTTTAEVEAAMEMVLVVESIQNDDDTPTKSDPPQLSPKRSLPTTTTSDAVVVPIDDKTAEINVDTEFKACQQQPVVPAVSPTPPQQQASAMSALPPKKKFKRFRFATAVDTTTPTVPLMMGGVATDETNCFKAVQTTVHEVEEYKHIDLWWNGIEMLEMRKSAIETVKYFRKYRLDYIEHIETIASSGTKKKQPSSATDMNNHKQNLNFAAAAVEYSLKEITMKDSFARGLETHIVSFLSRTRSDTVQAVLEEQRECGRCGDSYELTAESLRGQSLAYSDVSRTFAIQMAQCDHIEALKASLASWST